MKLQVAARHQVTMAHYISALDLSKYTACFKFTYTRNLFGLCCRVAIVFDRRYQNRLWIEHGACSQTLSDNGTQS